MVKVDCWDVEDAQVDAKTGHPLAHWKDVLGKAGAATLPSNDVVAPLQQEHGLPRYWARTLTTWFAKQGRQLPAEASRRVCHPDDDYDNDNEVRASAAR